jgi:hypothetical protein
LWLVLLACLRGTGLSQAQLPWQTSLAAFALIRLLTALPITPGGLGITELGLIGALTAGAGHQHGVQITAAVLMYRAVTYLPPIPLGALACLTWRLAPGLINVRPSLSGADGNLAGVGAAEQVDEGVGGVLQARHDGFGAAELALAQPAADVGDHVG